MPGFRIVRRDDGFYLERKRVGGVWTPIFIFELDEEAKAYFIYFAALAADTEDIIPESVTADLEPVDP